MYNNQIVILTVNVMSPYYLRSKRRREKVSIWKLSLLSEEYVELSKKTERERERDRERERENESVCECRFG